MRIDDLGKQAMEVVSEYLKTPPTTTDPIPSQIEVAIKVIELNVLTVPRSQRPPNG